MYALRFAFEFLRCHFTPGAVYSRQKTAIFHNRLPTGVNRVVFVYFYVFQKYLNKRNINIISL